MPKVREDTYGGNLIFISDALQDWAKIENTVIKIAVNACSVHTVYVSEGPKMQYFLLTV